MVLYFTGTGNSKYVAEKIGSIIDDDVVNLFDRIKNKDYSTISSENSFVVVCPTYAWQVPHIVKDYLLRTPLNGNKDIYFVLTCGDSIGNAYGYAKKIALQKGLNIKGVAKVIMPENYIAMFGSPDNKTARKIIKKADNTIENIAKIIKDNKEISNKISLMDRVNSSVVNIAFYGLCVKDSSFYYTDGCVSCGLCQQVCPLNNITIEKGKPKWSGNCTHCMACINHCPKEAIEYGKHSKGQNRYTLEKAIKID